MAHAIEVHGLQKSFGPARALAGLDLTVRTGEVHAFLGPNGAGKTTTLRILLGLLKADGGEARFALDPAKKAHAYSKGNRQKVALVAALASDAELLLLDEPTSGLDPIMEATFRDCVEDERRSGRTILLSSHILAEAEALSDRVSIIRDGRCVETGTLAELRHLTRTAVDAELAGPVSLDGVPGVHDLDVVGLRVRCQVDNEALNDVLRRLTEAGIRTVTCQPPTLEELFLRHYLAERDVAGAAR